ncbi:hypothetical protein B9Z65_7044 [Elsinoe australis]|uniref:Heterokaryon incompatibility domain-containing protein n=1 Tax=Elsinoe australis TaxID=40998 RepID=A0A2P7Z4E2_9PEZI|nr:hypothetical protein B9Z65_7044 [Elsinoe australis]
MGCELCFELLPPTLQEAEHGKRAGLFLAARDLQKSQCEYCKLLWQSLCLRKTEWSETELDKLIEVTLEVGKPLRIRWRADYVDLQLFTDPGPRSLPSRVVAVGAQQGDTPYLLETQGKSAKYIALSYCWGPNAKVVKTTRDVLTQHTHALPIHDFPQTYLDAIALCRHLRIPYLWIDALCILQGDSADWAQESSKMCDYYTHAHLVLAATRSPTSAGGLFGPQSFSASETLPLASTQIHVRPNLSNLHDRYSVQRRTDTSLGASEPIYTRAWCQQEASLSNRILHFSANELVWECNERYTCSCGYGDTPIAPDDIVSLRTLRRPDLALDEAGDGKAAAYHKWAEIAQLFCERQHGVVGDKLPAISGLARQFAKWLVRVGEGEPRYLAGLWEGDLARGLLWVMEDDYTREDRTEGMVYRRAGEWRAPSWSWACMEGATDFLLEAGGFVGSVRVLEAVSRKKTVDEFGMVKEGWLVLEALVREGLTVEKRKRGQGERNSGCVEGVKWSVGDEKARRVFIPDFAEELDLNEEYTCLEVGVVKRPRESQKESFFLVLRKAKGKNGVFERVGASIRPHKTDHEVDKYGLDIFEHALVRAVKIM